MQYAAPVQLHQYRDLGQIISATFQFIRENWRPLYRAIATICLPIGLVGGFLIGRTMMDLQEMTLDMDTTMYQSVVSSYMGNGLPMILGYLMLAFASIMLFAIVYEYLGAYHRNEHNGITTADLWRRSLAQIWSYLGMTILMGILLGIGFVLCILPGIYAAVALSFTFMAHAIERTDVLASMKRSNDLVKERWWETFGLIFIVVLIQSVISYALMLPTTIISFVVGVNSFIDVEEGSAPDLSWYPIFMAITVMLNMIVTLLTAPIMAISMGLKYFSVVEEKEGLSIRQKIQGFEQA